MNFYVKINKGSVKSDRDSQKLMKLQQKYNANCNTHSDKAMWFDFDIDKNAFKFAKQVVKKFKYLNVTIGQMK